MVSHVIFFGLALLKVTFHKNQYIPFPVQGVDGFEFFQFPAVETSGSDDCVLWKPSFNISKNFYFSPSSPLPFLLLSQPNVCRGSCIHLCVCVMVLSVS